MFSVSASFDPPPAFVRAPAAPPAHASAGEWYAHALENQDRYLAAAPKNPVGARRIENAALAAYDRVLALTEASASVAARPANAVLRLKTLLRMSQMQRIRENALAAFVRRAPSDASAPVIADRQERLTACRLQGAEIARRIAADRATALVRPDGARRPGVYADVAFRAADGLEREGAGLAARIEANAEGVRYAQYPQVKKSKLSERFEALVEMHGREIRALRESLAAPSAAGSSPVAEAARAWRRESLRSHRERILAYQAAAAALRGAALPLHAENYNDPTAVVSDNAGFPGFRPAPGVPVRRGAWEPGVASASRMSNDELV